MKELEHFQFKGLTIKDAVQNFEDAIGGHVTGPRIENLFFHNLKSILEILTQTAEKKVFFHYFISNLNCCGHIVLPPGNKGEATFGRSTFSSLEGRDLKKIQKTFWAIFKPEAQFFIP